MEGSARKRLVVGLGVGMMCVGLGMLRWWGATEPQLASEHPASLVTPAPRPDERVTTPDLATALHAEIERLKGRRDGTERLVARLQNELAALRAQRSQGQKGQDAMPAELARQVKELTEAYLAQTEALASDRLAQTPPMSPEDEEQRTDARIQAQVQLMDGTLDLEQADPDWASTAEQSLQDVLQREELGGLRLRQAQCRTSMCRLALSLNGVALPEESFRALVHLMPWQGQGFVRITDGESPEMVVYLAREGYTLPQMTE